MKLPPVRQRTRGASIPTPAHLRHPNLRLVTAYRPVNELKPPRRALRKHGKRQLSALMASVSEYGIVKPILVDPEGIIVAGYGVWLAAKELKIAEVPVVGIEHLTPEQLRLYGRLRAFDGLP